MLTESVFNIGLNTDKNCGLSLSGNRADFWGIANANDFWSPNAIGFNRHTMCMEIRGSPVSLSFFFSVSDAGKKIIIIYRAEQRRCNGACIPTNECEDSPGIHSMAGRAIVSNQKGLRVAVGAKIVNSGVHSSVFYNLSRRG